MFFDSLATPIIVPRSVANNIATIQTLIVFITPVK